MPFQNADLSKTLPQNIISPIIFKQFDFISKACILKSSNFKRTYFLNQKVFICKIMRNIIFLSLYNILVSEAELYYEVYKITSNHSFSSQTYT